MANHRAGRRYRVRKGAEVTRVFEQGRSVRDRVLTVLAVENHYPQSRLGVAVSRRHGSAVRRNRLKRLIREAFRLSRRQLPVGMDFVVAPRPDVPLTVAAARESLEQLAPQAAGLARRGDRKDLRP